MRRSLGAAHVRPRRWRMRQRKDEPHAARLPPSHAREAPDQAQLLTLDVGALRLRVFGQAGRRARFW